jgi:tetratricopeptide (TPR) repeat protein
MTASATTPREAAGGSAGLRVDVATGPAASYDGLRTALAELARAGASFGDLPMRYGAEWAVLRPETKHHGAPLATIALSASERRLHRESEQVFRVLSTGAAALCRAAAELGRPIVLGGVGQTDLTSLRGFMRAVEHARTVHGAQIALEGADRIWPTAVPYIDERLRCLRRMGSTVKATDVKQERGRGAVDASPERDLFDAAMDASGSARDRLAAALAYCRSAFFSANWEGTAIVATAALDLTKGMPDSDVDTLLSTVHSGSADGQAEAIEFEPAILRTAADVTAFLWKVLGIQATFRGDQDWALRCFHAMRDTGPGLSVELHAQSCLYAALTLTKRYGRHDDAAAELAQGFSVVPPQEGEPASVRRERGWLHNLRGLTHFSRTDLRAALEDEKAALDCIHGLRDDSSVHLRVNLLSNISVLQEAANMFEPALRTWGRFRDAAGAYQPNFAKHHAYREAGLMLKLGDRIGALAGLARSAQSAAELHDDFHGCEIGLEASALLIEEGRAAEAMSHLDGALAAARRLGDPYRIALAMAGLSAPASEIADMAARSLTHPRAAVTLADLPRPRTKLNRPFDLVNI